MRQDLQPSPVTKVVLIAHETQRDWVDIVCVAAEEALPVHAVYIDPRIDPRADSLSLCDLDDTSLVMLCADDFDAALATVYTLRAGRIDGPILLVSPVQEEDRLLRAYVAGVDECIHATIGLPLLLAKLRAWLRWTPNALGFPAFPDSPC